MANSRTVPRAPMPTRTPGTAVAALVAAAAVALTGCGAPSSGSAASDRDDSVNGSVHGTVTVLAAASLTEVFTTIGRDFERRRPGTTVRLSFGPSSGLAQQIQGGAPADVFAAASPSTMRQVGDHAVDPVRFAENQLQIAVPAGNPGRVRGLADFAEPDLTLAVCEKQVPCGEAAVEAFDAAGVTPRPDTYGNDVKSVLTGVRLGEVDAGLVYRTDVRAAGSQVAGIDLPASATPVNHYPIAVLDEAPNPPAARAFVSYVRSAKGRHVLARAGFGLP